MSLPWTTWAVHMLWRSWSRSSNSSDLSSGVSQGKGQWIINRAIGPGRKHSAESLSPHFEKTSFAFAWDVFILAQKFVYRYEFTRVNRDIWRPSCSIISRNIFIKDRPTHRLRLWEFGWDQGLRGFFERTSQSTPRLQGEGLYLKYWWLYGLLLCVDL